MNRILAISVLVIGLAVPVTARAQGTLLVDVNAVGATSLQDEQTYTFTTTISSETATVSSTYPKIGTAFGGVFGAAWVGSFPIGFGVNVTRASYEMEAGLRAHIPHPLYFNQYGNGVGVHGALDRTETAVDLSAVFVPTVKGPMVVRLFAGPTYFHARQDMVSVVRYGQIFNLFGGNVITITPPDTVSIHGSTWGFHVGGDVAWFFTRHVGVGGVVRVNKATLDIDEPLTGTTEGLTVGHAVYGGGLRLRF